MTISFNPLLRHYRLHYLSPPTIVHPIGPLSCNTLSSLTESFIKSSFHLFRLTLDLCTFSNVLRENVLSEKHNTSAFAFTCTSFLNTFYNCTFIELHQARKNILYKSICRFSKSILGGKKIISAFLIFGLI